MFEMDLVPIHLNKPYSPECLNLSTIRLTKGALIRLMFLNPAIVTKARFESLIDLVIVYGFLNTNHSLHLFMFISNFS